MTNGNGDGIRITNREIYDKLVALELLMLRESGRTDSLTTQVRLLWTLYGSLIVIAAGVAFAVQS